MFTATGRKAATHRLGLNGPERLEARELLSANLGGRSQHVHHLQSQATAMVDVDVAIRGSEVGFDAYGLPSYMAGDVSLVSAGSGSGSTIGRYEEALTPILMDVTGDGYPDFIGTMGVATFTFFVGQSQPVNLGSITTANVSYIQGFTAAGQLLVGSTGTIVASTGVFAGAAGGFTSTSTVSMYPTFEMDTSVHFNASRAVSRVLSALDWVAGHVQGSDGHQGDSDGDSDGDDDADRKRHGDGHHGGRKHQDNLGRGRHSRGPDVEHVLSKLVSQDANKRQWEKAVDRLASDLGRWQRVWDRV